MRSGIKKRDILSVFVIFGLALLLSISAHEAITEAFHRQIVRDAEHTAQGWATFLVERTSNVEAVVAGGRPTTQNLRLLQLAHNIGDVKRFKLFDRSGILRFASDDPFAAGDPTRRLSARNPVAAAVVKSGRPYTEIREHAEPDRTALYAETYLPIIRNGDVVAIAEVFVDQTAKRSIFADSFFVAMLFTPLLIAGGFGIPAIGYYLRSRQVSRIETEAVDSNRNLKVVLDNMTQGFCMFDADQRLIVANDQYLRLYNLPPEMGEPGVTLREILDERIARGVFPGDDAQAYLDERFDCVARAEHRRTVHELQDGRVLAVTHKPLPDGGWLTTHDDITALQQIERRITYLAHHDAVTGLPNRTSFRNTITALTEADGDGFAVLCLDLDHFKGVNDTLGHPIGDQLLQEVAKRLRTVVSDTDTAARLGGDEFAVIQPAHDQPAAAKDLANRICGSLLEPFSIEGHQIMISTSVGIALSPADGATPDELLRNADMALYSAKSERRSSFQFFETEMAERMTARRRMEVELRTALRDGQFELKYQPLVDVKTNAVSGFEALLRWNHPERGLLAPSEFVTLTEEIGLIVPLGEWVVREACAEAANWPEDIQVAINISAPQFRCGKLVPMVINALSSTGLAPRRLELEITESILTQYSESTLETLHMLRNLGVRISLDDFGMGNSSLSYLRSFPFDKLKLHGSFVRDLDGTRDARAILRGVASLGNSLGMVTSVEGVETLEQHASVQADGFAEIQGYFFSPPLSPDEVMERYFPDRKSAASVA